MQHRALPLLDLRFGERECRHRRPAYVILLRRPVLLKKEPITSWTSFTPGACFVIAVLVYLAAGLVCVAAVPPVATTKFGTTELPAEATCLRATRHTNYATVDLAVGSPPSLLNLLLRLDMIKANDATSLRLFSNRVAESNTVACDNTACTDVAFVHPSGPSSSQVQSVVQFEYTNPTTESTTYGTAVTIGLDGEFALKRGYDYYLTATHLCWAPTVRVASWAEQDAFRAEVQAGLLVANAAELGATSAFGGSPAGLAGLGATCEIGLGSVRIFPGAAADEATWLGLASKRAYEVSPDGVEDRRIVVEVGTACAANHSSYARSNSLYELDCLSVYLNCDDSAPSLPFRRAAAAQLMLQIRDDGTDEAVIFATHDRRLEWLPKLSNTEHVMGLSLLKLGLMMLAAAVTWVRAAKSTASVDRLFMHCVRMAHCPKLDQLPPLTAVVVEDGIIGLLAIGARIGVSIWRWFSLSVDGQGRAPAVQFIAGCLSLAQFVVRYVVLRWRYETPLTKLGGSTALVDATCAVMMGFAEPPLLVSAIGRFDPTARLLTALLVSTMTLQRCLFATACCGLLYATASEDVRRPTNSASEPLVVAPGAKQQGANSSFDIVYLPIIFLGLVAWLLQTASVAVLMADVFAVPLAHSMARSLACGWEELSMVIFTATAAAGLPTLMVSLQYIARDSVRPREKENGGDK